MQDRNYIILFIYKTTIQQISCFSLNDEVSHRKKFGNKIKFLINLGLDQNLKGINYLKIHL